MQWTPECKKFDRSLLRWSELWTAKHVAEHSWDKMRSGAQKHDGSLIKSSVLRSAKYLAVHWDEMNFGAQKYGGALLRLRELQSAHKMKNHTSSECKMRKSRNENRVFPQFLNFFSNIVLDSYFSSFPSMTWNSETQLHFLERKEKQLKLFYIFKTQKKNHLWIFNSRIKSNFRFYQNFLCSEFWEDHPTKNRFS